jgi:anti-anti-sigma factor
MDVASSHLLSAPIFEIRGEIDHSNASVLRAAVDEPLDQGAQVILLDLSEVDYIDSGGVSVLLSTVRRLRNRGWLGVVNPNSNVRRLLEIVGLTVDHGFRLFGTREEASQALEDAQADEQG